MGFLSSLFGTKRSSSPSSTVVQSSKLPEEIAPFVKEILGEAQQLYKGELARGYQPYTGATIAPLTPDQEAALTGLAGLPGTTTPFLEKATEIYETGGERFTPEIAEEFMSPYQRAVTDIEKREAQRQFERNIMPRFEAEAVGAGGLTGLGTRAGVEAAELQRGQSQLLSDIEAKGLQKAYDDARKGFEQQKLRERGMAADLSGLGTQALTSRISELGAQKAAGEERQALGQSALDEAYYKFLEKQQFPQETLAQYSGTVYGNPLAKTFDTTDVTSRPQPSTGQSLLSLGLSGLGMFGMGRGNIYGGGFPIRTAGGGSIGRLSDKNLGKYMREGSGAISAGDRDQLMRMYKSGLSGLPVIRRQMGSIGTDPEAFGEPINWREVDRTIGKYAGPPARYINKILTDLAGAPVDVATQVLNKLGITSIAPSQAIGGSQSIKRGMKNVLGSEVLPPPTTEEIMATSSRQPDLEVDVTTIEGVEPPGTVPTKDDILKLKMEEAKQDTDKEKKVGVVEQADMLLTEPKKPDTTKKDDVSGFGFISSMIENNTKFQKMIDEGITSVNDLQDQLKEAIGQDKKTRKDSRTKRNELAFWRSLLIAGEAVGSADPSQGFLAAAAKGATAGGKSLVEARMKLAKEAEGDGQRAIDAAKTLLAVETADIKLQQAALGVEGNLLTAMANWTKANKIKTNPQTLTAAVRYINDTVNQTFKSATDARKGEFRKLLSAHVLANINNKEEWAKYSIPGRDRAFSGNPNISATDAINQVKRGLTVSDTNK